MGEAHYFIEGGIEGLLDHLSFHTSQLLGGDLCDLMLRSGEDQMSITWGGGAGDKLLPQC